MLYLLPVNNKLFQVLKHKNIFLTDYRSQLVKSQMGTKMYLEHFVSPPVLALTCTMRRPLVYKFYESPLTKKEEQSVLDVSAWWFTTSQLTDFWCSYWHSHSMFPNEVFSILE